MIPPVDLSSQMATVDHGAPINADAAYQDDKSSRGLPSPQPTDPAMNASSPQAGASSSQTTKSASEKEQNASTQAEDKPQKVKKGRAFWMIIFSLAMSMFLSALDLTALSTALPRIATDLDAENFTWIGSAYALASTAFCTYLLSLRKALPLS